MKKLLLALALLCSPVLAEIPFMPSAYAEEAVPQKLVRRVVQLTIFCAPTIGDMIEVIGEKFGEVTIVGGELNEAGDTSFVIMVNKDYSSNSIVIIKNNGACLVWGGNTEPGMALSINPNPVFPIKREEVL